MPPLRSSLRFALCAALLCLSTACRAEEPPAEAALPELGLMGTIPIYWGEAGDVGELVAGGSAGHWARAQLEAEFSLRPLDALSDDSLAGLDALLLVQPRALGPAENVALDGWVRAGGRLLLFADPMLTGDTRFAIGDRRRPQDVILLSPILAHWGLELEFEEEQLDGTVLILTTEVPLPVELAGSLALREGEAQCRHLGARVLAQCAIGRGGALILADAALLDLHDPDPAAAAAFGWLLDEAFDKNGESTGNEAGGPGRAD